ncbi:MAG: ABC transporter permease [Acidobacteriota bacterium]|nr:MAG: ABC transporter permease [Acidobacteriota bacterium]
MRRFVGTAFYENVKMAFETLISHKLRSMLTVVGVVIGVVVVMLMSSVISGINVGVQKEIESFGTNSIFLYKYEIGISFGRRSREERMRPPLTIADAEALKELPAIETAVPFLDVSSNRWGNKILVTGKNGKTSSSINMQGTTADLEKTNTEILVKGRWFTQSESETKRDVALIGDTVANDYFPNQNPLGEKLEIGGREFTIIGVLQKREQFFGGGGGDNDQSNIIYMPLGSGMRIKPNSEDLFILAIAEAGKLEEGKDQVQDLLRVRRQVPYGEPNNFSMATAASIIEQFQAITQGVFIVMFVISSVGLMIGGIGVMNIMLVSVTERTREIGIRKSIGAKKSDILLQFLTEAATLTGFGGVMGLLIGWFLTFLIALFFPSYVPWWAPPLGFFASVSIGVVFGLWPAWKAARLDPIESLRYE